MVTAMGMLFPVPHSVIRIERPWQQGTGPIAKA